MKGPGVRRALSTEVITGRGPSVRHPVISSSFRLLEPLQTGWAPVQGGSADGRGDQEQGQGWEASRSRSGAGQCLPGAVLGFGGCAEGVSPASWTPSRREVMRWWEAYNPLEGHLICCPDTPPCARSPSVTGQQRQALRRQVRNRPPASVSDCWVPWASVSPCLT